MPKKKSKSKYVASRKRNIVYTPRKCLRCLKTFKSTGVGNRICPKCSKKDDPDDVHTEYLIIDHGKSISFKAIEG